MAENFDVGELKSCRAGAVCANKNSPEQLAFAHSIKTAYVVPQIQKGGFGLG